MSQVLQAVRRWKLSSAQCLGGPYRVLFVCVEELFLPRLDRQIRKGKTAIEGSQCPLRILMRKWSQKQGCSVGRVWRKRTSPVARSSAVPELARLDSTSER